MPSPEETGTGDSPLYSTMAGEPDMVPLIVRVVASLPESISALRAAAEQPDRERLQSLAHQLKGAGGGYGFGAITEAAEHLETAVLASASQPEIDSRLAALIDLMQCARIGLDPADRVTST